MRPTLEAQVRERQRNKQLEDLGFGLALRIAIPAGMSGWAAFSVFGHFVLIPLMRLAIG
ncbi:MAG: hypothetical protein AAB478_03745 [Patescibacteria group bacterium]